MSVQNANPLCEYEYDGDSSKAPRTGEDIRTFSERKLTEAEIREVDVKLALLLF